MMFDLIVKGGTLPDGTVADIAVKGDRIAAVGRVEGPSREVIDATGDLVSPPFVDPHFHMDATLSLGMPQGLSITSRLEPRWHAAIASREATLLTITRTTLVDALEDDADTAVEVLAAMAGIASTLRDRVAEGAPA